MQKFPPKSGVNEIYNNIIEITIEGLKSVFKKKKFKGLKFNLLEELKSRWEIRVNSLFLSLDGSWSKFQENSNKTPSNTLDERSSVQNLLLLSFPVVCTLSGEFFRHSHSKRQNKSGFKSWIWNILVSKIVSENVYPLQSIETRVIPYAKKFQIFMNFKDMNYLKKKRNIFLRFKYLIKKYLNEKTGGGNLSALSQRFPNHVQIKSKEILSKNSNSAESEIDEDVDSQLSEEKDEHLTQNFIVANVEKVYRKHSKWRVFLKEGILHVDEKDLLFNACKCEFSW
mmetsp:Transcript_24425/g.58223  ORF Transcript_24425/g.58223 Transcript_24425/m.58223 type:complete len:283 (+) Transcript_24425:93-941(+)